MLEGLEFLDQEARGVVLDWMDNLDNLDQLDLLVFLAVVVVLG